MGEVGSLVKIIAEYGFLIVCAAIFLYLAYSMFKKQQNWLETFIDRSGVQQNPTREEIKALDIVNEKIFQELRGVVASLNADRAYIYLYHNGGHSSSGLSFQRMSCICEVVSQGILPVADQKQSLYRASYTGFCNALREEGKYFVDDVYDLKGQDDFIYNEFMSRHAESVYFRALKDISGNVIGFLGIDYCSSKDRLKISEIDHVLRSIAIKLSSLVDIRDEVK